MSEYDVKRLALVLAVQAEIEGMKAKNAEHKFCNSEPCYDEHSFYEKAEELNVLASKHDHQL